jgi:RimJ/RimL family protein N-acetyltransferase
VTFEVRRLNGSDAQAYRELRLEGLKLSPAAFGASLDEELERPAGEWGERLERGYVYGLFEAGALVGTAGFFAETMRNTAHRGRLFGVYLTPSARGRGGSDQLIAAVIAEARNHVLQLHLAVTNSNDSARRLYERHGFETYAIDPRGLRVDGVFHDDCLMVLRLD